MNTLKLQQLKQNRFPAADAFPISQELWMRRAPCPSMLRNVPPCWP